MYESLKNGGKIDRADYRLFRIQNNVKDDINHPLMELKKKELQSMMIRVQDFQK